MKGIWFITPHTIDCKTLTSLFAPSSETQGQIVGTRESLNGQRKNTRALDFSSPIFFVARLEFPRSHYLPLSLRGCFFSRFSVVQSLRYRCVTRKCVMHESREATQGETLSRPTPNFHARSRFFMIRFQPSAQIGHTLKYGLACSLPRPRRNMGT